MAAEMNTDVPLDTWGQVCREAQLLRGSVQMDTNNNIVEPDQLRQVLEKMWNTNWQPCFLAVSKVKTFQEGCDALKEVFYYDIPKDPKVVFLFVTSPF